MCMSKHIPGIRSVIGIGIFVLLFIVGNGCSPNSSHVRPSYRSAEPQKKVATPFKEDDKKTNQDIEQGELKRVVDSYKGVRYRPGGTTIRGMDCSGFVWKVFSTLGRIEIPRTSSAELYKMGRSVPLSKARLGDLVFFKRRGRIFHVGIYMGNNMFAHASSKQGIIYTSLDSDYFKRRFVGVRRIY